MTKHIYEKWTGAAKAILLILVSIIFLFFTWYSFRFSCYTGTDYIHKILTKEDSMIGNILALLLALLAVIGLGVWMKKCPVLWERLEKILLRCVCVAAAGLSVWWAFASHTAPDGDQLIVSAAAVYAKGGDYTMMSRGGQINIHPHQHGLVLVYEMIFRLFGDFQYGVIYIIYGVMNGLTILFGYLFLKEAFESARIRIWYLILMLVCFPLFIYTPYLYGDIPSIFLTMLLFWAVVRLEKTSRYRYGAVACIAGAFSVLVRKNSWIVICGVIIGLLLIALEKKRLRFAAMALVLVLSAAGTVRGVEISYELRSGYEVDGGIPSILYIAMGMQENENAQGRYNNYIKDVYFAANLNQELAAEVGVDYINQRLDYFRRNPSETFTFYKLKLLTQWNEPLYESLLSNYLFSKEPEGIIDNIYHGSLHDKLFTFCDRYQFIIFAGCLLAGVFSLLQGPEGAAWCIPFIAIVGGFLFSILWEAQCRYVLPYFLFGIMYAAYGIVELAAKVTAGIKLLVRGKLIHIL